MARYRNSRKFIRSLNLIEIIERRQGLKVACIEEIAYKKGYINKSQLIKLAQPIANNQYGKYLIKCAEEGN